MGPERTVRRRVVLRDRDGVGLRWPGSFPLSHPVSLRLRSLTGLCFFHVIDRAVADDPMARALRGNTWDIGSRKGADIDKFPATRMSVRRGNHLLSRLVGALTSNFSKYPLKHS